MVKDDWKGLAVLVTLVASKSVLDAVKEPWVNRNDQLLWVTQNLAVRYAYVGNGRDNQVQRLNRLKVELKRWHGLELRSLAHVDNRSSYLTQVSAFLHIDEGRLRVVKVRLWVSYVGQGIGANRYAVVQIRR